MLTKDDCWAVTIFLMSIGLGIASGSGVIGYIEVKADWDIGVGIGVGILITGLTIGLLGFKYHSLDRS